MNRNELLKAMDEELRMGRGMDGVLSAVVKETLGPLTAEERGIAGADYCTRPACLPGDYNDVLQFTLKNFIASRRACFEKVKTAERRVTLHSDEYDNCWVNLDGKSHSPEMSRVQANIYRLGLIAQLKEKESQ